MYETDHCTFRPNKNLLNNNVISKGLIWAMKANPDTNRPKGT